MVNIYNSLNSQPVFLFHPNITSLKKKKNHPFDVSHLRSLINFIGFGQVLVAYLASTNLDVTTLTQNLGTYSAIENLLHLIM